MTEEFFKSEIVQEELNDLQETYTDLLQMSQDFEGFDNGQKIEHINKTLELIAKQKVFYSRLEMMANYVAEEEDSETEVQEMKGRIDMLSTMYTGGNGNLLQVLQVMEDKLIGWKKELQTEG
tara:strand:- start:27307 stop:27672 length:366 start_codon:yes stop_codon:yes gene_type:complete